MICVRCPTPGFPGSVCAQILPSPGPAASSPQSVPGAEGGVSSILIVSPNTIAYAHSCFPSPFFLACPSPLQYHGRTKLLHRRFVAPTFQEIRHILNIATVHAVSPVLKMVTFDADDTIYEDGGVYVIHYACVLRGNACSVKWGFVWV